MFDVSALHHWELPEDFKQLYTNKQQLIHGKINCEITEAKRQNAKIILKEKNFKNQNKKDKKTDEVIVNKTSFIDCKIGKVCLK